MNEYNNYMNGETTEPPTPSSSSNNHNNNNNILPHSISLETNLGVPCWIIDELPAGQKTGWPNCHVCGISPTHPNSVQSASSGICHSRWHVNVNASKEITHLMLQGCTVQRVNGMHTNDIYIGQCNDVWGYWCPDACGGTMATSEG